MKIVNLTPHAVTVLSQDGAVKVTVPPSGAVARVTQATEPATHGEWAAVSAQYGFPVSVPVYGAMDGLPEQAPGTIYIVSAMVRAAAPSRLDLASPGDLVRNEAGQPTGCRGLFVNAAS